MEAPTCGLLDALQDVRPGLEDEAEPLNIESGAHLNGFNSRSAGIGSRCGQLKNGWRRDAGVTGYDAPATVKISAVTCLLTPVGTSVPPLLTQPIAGMIFLRVAAFHYSLLDNTLANWNIATQGPYRPNCILSFYMSRT